MRKLLFTLVGFICSLMHFAYAQECGTVATSEQVAFMNNIDKEIKSQLGTRIQNVLVKIPIKAHIVRNTDGSGGLSLTQLENALKIVNDHYINTNIQFFLDGGVNYINKTSLYDFESSQEEEELAVPNDRVGVINIYFLNTITADGSGLCGYTRFPPSTDRIFMANGCTTNGSTLAHEIGHYFTLFHTHGKTNTGTTDELVNGSNCATAGDNVCDTPADPNLSGVVNGSCQYTGTRTDANGQPYKPMVNNFMAYSPSQCRNAFTSGQYQRIRNGFENGRNYLNYITQNFEARFSTELLSVCVPATVQFTNKTTGAVKLTWSFPGGTPSSSILTDPKVIYEKPGTYDVTLVAEDKQGNISSVTKKGIIQVIDPLQGAIAGGLEEQVATNEVPGNWTVNNRDQSITFQVSSIDRNEDQASNSFFINNYIYETKGPNEVDDLITPKFDSREVSSYLLEFNYAYTYYIDPSPWILPRYDTLVLIYKVNCEDTWQTINKEGGKALATATPMTDEFVPNSSQWKKMSKTVALPKAGIETITFGFRNLSGRGNNLYLDNIVLTPIYTLTAPSSLELVQKDRGFIKIKWSDKSVNETSFVIERSIDGTNFVPLDTVDVNVVEYQDANLPGVKTVYYRVYGINSKGESGTSNVLKVDNVPLAVSNELNKDIKLYPNPVDRLLTVSVNNMNGDLNFTVIDIFGREVKKGMFKNINKNQDFSINVAELPSGVYIVHFLMGDKTGNLRIVKN